MKISLFRIKKDSLNRLLPFFVAIFAGFSLGYFIDSLILSNIRYSLFQQSYKHTSPKIKREIKDLEKTIIKNDVFNIEKDIKTKNIKVKVVSNINGYKLVGFVSGKDAMALFKKGSKPVVVATKQKGIDKTWVLYKITSDGVYLKNKKTKEIKKFAFPSIKKELSLFGKNISVSYTKSALNQAVEKITVNKNILSKIGDINYLFKQINIIPAFKNGKAFGYKINYIAPSSMLNKIGLKVGDTIVSINGEPTTSPDKIMNLYSQIKEMTSVNLDVIRGGAKKTLFIVIK